MPAGETCRLIERKTGARGSARLLLTALLGLTCAAAPARAGIVYQDTSTQSDFTPLPYSFFAATSRGLGNQITLGGTDRQLTSVSISFGSFEEDPFSIPFTLTLYKNDGPADPNGSGQLQPGTVIASSAVTGTSAGGPDGSLVPFTVTFPFTNVAVPNTFTAVVTAGSGWFDFDSDDNAGMGPSTTSAAPTVGSALNTMWVGTPGNFQTSNRGIAAGGGTNYFSMTVNATPAPSGLTLAGIGAAGLIAFGWWRGRRVPCLA